MENNGIEKAVDTAKKTVKATGKTVTTGQLVGLGAGCAVGGAAVGIGAWEGIKALRRKWKARKEKKASEKKPEETKKEETPTEKPAEPAQTAT